MRTTAALALAIGAASVSAFPLAKRAATPTDTQILQYACESTSHNVLELLFAWVDLTLTLIVTLEHLENSFYSDALQKFDAAAFKSAGFPDYVRGRSV
jgi:hypothetical protein